MDPVNSILVIRPFMLDIMYYSFKFQWLSNTLNDCVNLNETIGYHLADT